MTEPCFVVGATGYTGRAVVEVLRGREVPVVAHIRPDSRHLETLGRHFTTLGARVDDTPWDEDAMTATLRSLQPGCVFALLGTTRARGKAAARAGGARETYETVDLGLTLLLLRAATACGSAPRFVYLSAIGADRPRNAYYAARHDAEAGIRASGLPWIVARPSFVTGADREEQRPAERVGAWLGDRVLDLGARLGAGRLRDRYASLTGRELARALVSLALDPDAPGAIYETDALRGRL